MGKNKNQGNRQTFAQITQQAKDAKPPDGRPQLATITFRQYECGEKFCLSKCAEADVQMALTCLRKICERTWSQIHDSRSKNPADKTGLNYEKHDDNELKSKRPANISPELPIHSVRASGVFRIYGVRIEGSFRPIWFVTDHSMISG